MYLAILMAAILLYLWGTERALITAGSTSCNENLEPLPSMWNYLAFLMAAILWAGWGTINPGAAIGAADHLGPSHPDRCWAYFSTKPTGRSSWDSCKRRIKSYGRSSPCFDHWLVAFEYEDQLLVCDAVNIRGELTGRCREKGKKEFHKKNPLKIPLGEFDIPKVFLRESVKRMEKNGRYDLLVNNCQTWIKKLLNRTGVASSVDMALIALLASSRATKCSQFAPSSGGDESSEE